MENQTLNFLADDDEGKQHYFTMHLRIENKTYSSNVDNGMQSRIIQQKKVYIYVDYFLLEHAYEKMEQTVLKKLKIKE
jgi:hypothetical protein